MKINYVIIVSNNNVMIIIVSVLCIGLWALVSYLVIVFCNDLSVLVSMFL